MENIRVFEQNGLVPIYQNEEEKLVNARELHEFLEVGREFAHWVKERVDKYGFEEGSDFFLLASFGNQTGRGGHNKRDYLLTLDTAKEIAMVENNPQGRKVRRYFIEVEKRAREMFSQPRSFSEALYLAAELQKKLEESKPKVLFADAVEASSSSILIGELAKLIKQNGVDVGQKRLFSWMRDNGYLMKNKNIPTQRSMEMKLMEIKERTVNNPDGSVMLTQTTKITGKGQQYFVNKFLAS